MARWRPYVREIALADLWIAPGDTVILPPKRFPAQPRNEEDPWLQVVDLHGNRNSALATWNDSDRRGLVTQTILVDPATNIHYHEEIAPTRHARIAPWM